LTWNWRLPLCVVAVIALAYVPPEFGALGTELKVEIRGQGVKAQVVATPFYKRPKKA